MVQLSRMMHLLHHPQAVTTQEDMLRLQPSQITLTQKDIDDYKQRSESGSRVVRLIGRSSFVDASDKDTALPVLRQGAQRSRDEAVVHRGALLVSRSAEATVVDLDEGSGDVRCQIPHKPHYDPLAEIPLKDEFRRDSVLSNEETSSSNESSRQEQDSPKSARSVVTASPPTRRNAVHGRRNSAGGYSAAAASSRRYRPRSLSDPCEAPVLSLKPKRPQTGSSSTVISTALQSSSIAMNEATTAVKQQPCGGLSSVPENFGIGEVDQAWPSSPEASQTRPRHHSVPDQYLSRSYSISDSNEHWEYEAGSRRQSLTTSELLSTQSPLEALSADLGGRSSSGWTADLPVRHNEEQGTIPILTALDVQDSLSQGESFQTLSPSRTISDDELGDSSPSGTGHPDQWRQTLTNTTMSQQAARTSRRSMFQSDRPLPTTLALGQGGRPRVGSLAHPSSSAPIQRRVTAANAEQENEQNMHDLERERQLQQERMQEDVGGVIETTPPPSGRLERRFPP